MLVPSRELIAVLRDSENNHPKRTVQDGEITERLWKIRKEMSRRKWLKGILALAGSAAIAGTIINSCGEKEKSKNPLKTSGLR